MKKQTHSLSRLGGMSAQPRQAMLRLICLLLLLAPLARAHLIFPFGEPLIIPRGEERSFYIIADVMEENATDYSFVSNSHEEFAKVTTRPLNFSQKHYGSWTIRGDKLGTTTIVFHWKYAKDKSGNEGEENETVVVQVVEPGSSAAANGHHLYVADPVNSRNGEYLREEAFGPSLGGPMPLGFASYYSSSLAAGGVAAGALGANRLHNFEWKLTVAATNLRVDVRTDHGRVFTFEKRRLSKVWTQTGRADVVGRLMEEEGIFYFFCPASQRVWIFDAAGKLTSISDGRGNTHTLTYAGVQLTGVVDGLGRSLAFTYAGARLTRVTDHTGRHVDFIYTGANLTRYTDALGHFTTFAYDAGNLLTSFTRPEGNSPFTQVFTAGKVTSQTERGTDTTTMTYGPGATTITQPGGATMTHTYAPRGEIAAYVDEGGKAVGMISDSTGRRSRVLDREGDATSITYDAPSGLPATITNAEGRASTMTYKPRLLKLPGVADKAKELTFFDLAKVVFPDGTNESFLHDTFGNLLSRADRAGKKWTAAYDTRGLPLTVNNPAGGVATMTYDTAGNLVSTKDGATGATTIAYDVLNRPTTITRPGGATVIFTHDPADRLLTITDERGKTTTLAYDNNDRLVGVTDADTNALQLAYDVLDRPTGLTDRLGKTSTRTFGARGLPETATDRNGNTMTFAHDSRQRLAGLTDSGGKTWAFGYDEESLPIAVANPINPPGRVKRNSLGRPVEISNPLGHTSTVARDAMQRVTQSFDPVGRGTTFTYDKRGDLIGVAEQGGGTAKYSRDSLGKVTAIAAPDGGIWKTTYTPEGRMQAMTDPLGKAWQRTYDPRGRLSTLTFPDAVVQTLTYDPASNITRVQSSMGGTARQTFDFTYDNLNRLASASDPAVAGSGVTLAYDAESRLTNTLQNGVNFGATYDDGGRLKTVSYNNGALVVTYAYDSRNRLVQVTDPVSGAAINIDYDDAGRPTTLARESGVNATFSYDPAGRLTRIQDGAFIDIKYTRNAAGEVTVEDRSAPLLPSTAPGTETFALGKAGQITSSGFAYDARGRLTAAPGHTLAWDDAGRLVSNGGATFGYNAFGEIITRTEAGVTTRHFHHHAIAGSPIVAERAEATSTFTRYYVHTPGGRLLYSVDAGNNAVSYYHFDHVGSTLALSDENGAVTDSYAYSPFGENEQHTGPSTQPFTWLGALGVRKEGAVFHMRARYYDPKTARFLSRDPLPPRLADVKSLNPYAYANQNPLRYVDPRGGKSFVLPHVLEASGQITNTAFTFDTTIFSLIEDGCDNDREHDDVDRYAGWPNVMVQVFDLDGPRVGAPDRPQVESMHIHGAGGPLIYDPLDIVRANAAKFGGTVHSSASSMVEQSLFGTYKLAYWQRGSSLEADGDGEEVRVQWADAGLSESRPSTVEQSLFGSYKLAYWQRGHLADVLGYTLEADGGGEVIGGEWTDDGFSQSMPSQLEGNEGFTVWFR